MSWCASIINIINIIINIIGINYHLFTVVFLAASYS